MKIAVIGSRGYPYVYSGYETFVSELAPRLVEKGMEVHVYCHRKLFKNKPHELNGNVRSAQVQKACSSRRWFVLLPLSFIGIVDF